VIYIPYITQNRREEILPHIQKFWADCPIVEEGEMNYIITKLLEYYRAGHYKYSLFNKIIGLLECIKLEYYRRMLGMYEDTKKEENGDVYHW
jgi:hypothetical protein